MDLVMVFCPTWRLEPETLWAIFAMEFDCRRDYLFTHDNLSGMGMENVNWNYRKARRMFLEGEYTHLMTVESDVIPPPDAWKKLRALDVDVALGTYRFKELGSGYRLLNHTAEAEPGPVRGVGLGCAVIVRQVLEQIEFQDHRIQPCDIPFAGDVLAAGFEIWGHPGVACGHVEEEGTVVWPESEPAWFRRMRGFVPPQYDEKVRYYFRRGQKMRIKTLMGFSGPAGSFAPNHEYDVPKKLGRGWVNAGLAEEVKPVKAKKQKAGKEEKAE